MKAPGHTNSYYAAKPKIATVYNHPMLCATGKSMAVYCTIPRIHSVISS